MTDPHEGRPDRSRQRQPDAELAELVEIWRRACDDFVKLVRGIPTDQADLSTDLPGWTVRDVVAHIAHLESVLAGAPEETLEVQPAPHLRGLMNFYTEQGVIARRGRDLGALADEIEQSVARRDAALRADPPTDGSARAPRTPGGVAWDSRTLLSNRPLDVWMHDQDVRRAIDRPGGYDSPAARHVLTVLGRGLPMVLGKRLAPPPDTAIRVAVPDADLSWSVQMCADGRAAVVDERATTAPAAAVVTLTPEDFVVLAGGRRAVETTHPVIEGDQDLARRLLRSLAVTP